MLAMSFGLVSVGMFGAHIYDSGTSDSTELQR